MNAADSACIGMAGLHVGVRQSAHALTIRIESLASKAVLPASLMAQMLDAAERLLGEAGAHRRAVTACTLFVREPAHAGEAQRLLREWLGQTQDAAHGGPPGFMPDLQTAPAMETERAAMAISLVLARVPDNAM